MKEKNLPDDIGSKPISELKKMVDNIIKNLENEKDLEGATTEYQKLIKLNNMIEKKFQNISKEISQQSRDKISKIIKNMKYEKKVK